MVEVLAAWLPLVVILAVVIGGAVMSTRSYSRHVPRMEAMSTEMSETNRQMLTELRQIKEILKDRN